MPVSRKNKTRGRRSKSSPASRKSQRANKWKKEHAKREKEVEESMDLLRKTIGL